MGVPSSRIGGLRITTGAPLASRTTISTSLRAWRPRRAATTLWSSNSSVERAGDELDPVAGRVAGEAPPAGAEDVVGGLVLGPDLRQADAHGVEVADRHREVGLGLVAALALGQVQLPAVADRQPHTFPPVLGAR